MERELFGVRPGDVVCITGSGGKTSLMYYMAETLSRLGRVAVTTTTKIYRPESSRYEKLIIGDSAEDGRGKNITVLGSAQGEGKIRGLRCGEIERLKGEYDYILVEADGAKERILKGWNETEPCIPDFADITVGVVSIRSLGKTVGEESIHRLKLFTEATGAEAGDEIDTDLLNRYIETGGFFKGSRGREIIYINGVEEEGDILSAMKLRSSREIYFGSMRERRTARLKRVDAVVMASGYSRRFGGDKLTERIWGMPLVEHLLKKLAVIPFHRVIVVGRSSEMKDLAEGYGYEYVENKNAEAGQSESVKAGAAGATGDAIMYLPGDQAALKRESLERIIESFQLSGEITRPLAGGVPSSPVIFPVRYRESLMKLEGDSGGREVIGGASQVNLVEFASYEEFEDIDTREDLIKAEKRMKS